jgi:hypothetical protein
MDARITVTVVEHRAPKVLQVHRSAAAVTNRTGVMDGRC